MARTTATEVSEAIAAYHGLLERDAELADASRQMLVTGQPAANLTFGGKNLCTVLRPQFLGPDVYRRIRHGCALLTGAMFRLAERIPSDPALMDLLGLTPIERDLVATDPGFRQISPTSRLDSFMAGDSWKFVEYNAETPAAIAYEDVLSEFFLRLPIMQAFGSSHALMPLPARHHLLGALLDAYRQWGGQDTPTIAIVDWPGLPTAPEFELFAAYFRTHDIPVVICQPGQLSYDGNRLRAGSEPIDLVYRRVLTAELLAQPELAAPLIRAYQDHTVCVVNSFRSKLLHKKAIFALLSDEHHAALFTPAERAAIAEHIPWTRIVQEGTSSYDGKPIDLIPFILDHRERLVLKPNDEYGGKGVVIGWESTDEEWQAALRAALDEPYVAQERVPVSREPFPVAGEQGLSWVELAADLDPFVFGTEVNGVLTRLSAAALLNVTAGTGSVAPTFLVERR